MYGIAQVIAGLLGIGVGALVANVLASPRLPFPRNYALLFALAGVAILPSNVALALIREPPPTGSGQQAHERARSGWLALVTGDPTFRRLMACQVLVTMIQMASPFFVVHASEALHLPERIVGSFVIALAVAGVVASAALGWVSERWGPRYVIRIGSGIALFGPIVALAAHFWGGVARAYALTFVVLGVAHSIKLLGFRTYLMGIAREGHRPAYIGIANTVLGLLTLAPVLGGWLLEATSYVTLFGVTAVVVGLGFVLSLTLDAVGSMAK
jgi:MFS family permease